MPREEIQASCNSEPPSVPSVRWLSVGCLLVVVVAAVWANMSLANTRARCQEESDNCRSACAYGRQSCDMDCAVSRETCALSCDIQGVDQRCGPECARGSEECVRACVGGLEGCNEDCRRDLRYCVDSLEPERRRGTTDGDFEAYQESEEWRPSREPREIDD